MPSTPPNIAHDEDLLGRLTMRFRRAANPSDRKQITQEYAEVVERLIRSGQWQEAPPPEDQLPHDCMPPSFSAFWTQ